MKTLHLICISMLLIIKAAAQNSDNVGFELGDFTNWTAYTGTCCGGSFYVSGPINERHTIMQNQGYDNNSNNTIPFLAPGGGKYSVRLGNSNTGSQAERLSTSFLVTVDNCNYTYMYAVVMEDPPLHPYNDKPKFEIRVLDNNGNLIPGPCGYYKVTAGFDTDGWDGIGDIRYKNWTKVTVDLSNYIGKVMTIEFTTEDCGWGGHFGYAYIDAEIGNSEIKVMNFCTGAEIITLSAPDGYTKYRWIPGGETTKSITITNPVEGDTFMVELTNEAGCSTKLTNVLRQYPYPVISHLADTTICLGQSVCLKATATGVGNTYYWSGYSNPMEKLCFTPSKTTQIIVTARNKNNCYNEKSIDTFIVFVDTHMVFNLCCDRNLCRGDTVLLKSPLKSPNYEWSVTPLAPNTIHDSFGYFKIKDTIPISLKIWDAVCSYTNDVHFTLPKEQFNIFYFCDGDSNFGLQAPPSKYWLWSHNGDTTRTTVVHHPQDSQYIYVKLDTLKCSSYCKFQLIKFKEKVPIPVAPNDTFICSGNEIRLLGHDSGNSGLYGYWYSDKICCLHNGALVYPDKNVQYYYRINNHCKKSYIDTYRITVDTQAYFTLDKNKIICYGDSVCLNPKINSGSFSWKSYPAGYFSSDSVVYVRPFQKTIYFLTRYLNGCTYTASTTIDFHKRPAPKIVNYCENTDTLTLIADKRYSGYYWMPTYDTTAFTKIKITPSIKEVKLYCTLENQCKDTIHYQLKKLLYPRIQGPNDTIICISGSVYPDVRGKKSGYHYYWHSKDSTFFSNKMNPSISPLYSGWYYVRVTTDSNCSGPESVDSFFVGIDSSVIAVFGKDTTICPGNSVRLEPISGKGNYSWSSSPPGFSSTNKSIYVTPKVPTKYILTISNANCKGTPNSIMVNFFNFPQLNAGPNHKICKDSTLILKIDPKPQTSYYWTDNFHSFSSSNPKITVKPVVTTYYYITATDSNKCQNRDTVFIMVSPKPSINFGNLITVCENTKYTLNAYNPNCTYLWSTGETYPSITITHPGFYSVTVNNESCSNYREVEIVWLYKKDTLDIPNVFTPNNDGKNDFFKINTNNYQEFKLNIYNRWGQLVFSSISANISWDGKTSDGKQATEGVYYFSLYLKSNCEAEKHISGSISLFR